jgi:hypothetical protein
MAGRKRIACDKNSRNAGVAFLEKLDEQVTEFLLARGVTVHVVDVSGAFMQQFQSREIHQ